MSPEPWVRVQAAALSVVLIATVVLDRALFILCCVLLLDLFAFALWRKYRRDAARAGSEIPAHRARLDILIGGDARASLFAPLVLAVFSIALSPTPLNVAPYVRNAVATVALVATVVYASSLFDWYLILPRITGMLGARPCQSKGDPPTFPATWREVTRWWYIHRIVADFFFVYGLALALGMIAAGITGAASPWVDFAFTIVFGTFGAYKKAIWPAVKEAGHPRLIVGRTVGSRFGEPLYVFDVAIEGVQLVPVEKYERRAEEMRSEEKLEFERHPERLPLAHGG